MEYKFAGGNVVAADYDICTNVLRESGVSLPAEVRAGLDKATAQRMAALREINDLFDAAPSVPWEDDSRDAVRDILESRYV